MKRKLLAQFLVLALAVLASCATPTAPATTSPAPPATTWDTPTLSPTPTLTPQPVSEAVATLTVNVYDATSAEPVADGRVVVFQMLADYVEERFTNAMGQAVFADLKTVGTTMITVEAEGYRTGRDRVEIVEGPNTLDINLTALVGAVSTPAPTSPVPSRWIDAHIHLAPDACHEGRCGADLIVHSMDEAGIEKAVLFSIAEGPSEDVLDAWRRYPDRIVPLRGRDGLDINDPATLELYRRDLGTGLFYGVGEIRTRHGWYGVDDPSDHPVMLGLWQLAAEFGLPALVHMGTLPPGSPDQTDIPVEWLEEFERALDQCPSTTFIWAHAGPARADVVREMLDRHPNLYADLSARNPLFFEIRGREVPTEVLIHGSEWIQLLEDQSDRFMFGTDSYSAESYDGIPTLLTYVRYEVFSQLSEDAVEAIAHGNAERLYGIQPSE
jgi:predicted TIM-barrel fold metal-dependent hydrolase